MGRIANKPAVVVASNSKVLAGLMVGRKFLGDLDLTARNKPLVDPVANPLPAREVHQLPRNEQLFWMNGYAADMKHLMALY